MADKRLPGQGQEALFSPEEIPGVVIPEPHYPSVGVVERAQHLDKVFKFVNRVRQADGLQKFAENPDGIVDLEAQYGDKTAQVLDGAARNADEREKALKFLFAHAFGMFEMAKAGADITQTKAIAKQEYRDFNKRYGFGQPNKQIRDRQQKKIVISAGIINGSRYPHSGRLKPKKVA